MKSNDKNYYKILGVDYASCPDEIKGAYIALSVKYAPISNLWAKTPMGKLKRAYVKFAIKHAPNLIFWDKTIACKARCFYEKLSTKYTQICNLVDDSAIDKYQEIKEAYDVLRLLPKESDLYKRLGVERTATADEIKSAYRRCAFKLYTFSSLSDWGHETRRYLWHSWQNEEGKEAIERNKEISEAYDILHNPEKRRRYDKYGANADYSDIPPDHNNNLVHNNDVEQLLPLFPFYYGKGQKASVRHYLRLERKLD